MLSKDVDPTLMCVKKISKIDALAILNEVSKERKYEFGFN